MITLYINNIKIQTQPNTTVLQACNTLGLDIPKFCFQENLEIAGNCRMCLVEIKNSIKPVASCAMPVTEGMQVFTNSPLVQKARESVLEFLLLNHPLDCPICDQGGECDLQDQTMIFGSDKSRFIAKKRGVEDKNCGPFIKTIMTRCIHCTRCVRFANEIGGTDNIGTVGRGNKTEISFYLQNHFNSVFSANVVDLCPVGALTLKPNAFNSRSWELKKVNTVDILDSVGSNITIETSKNQIIRVLPRTNNEINLDWISNKTRFFYDSLKYQRIQKPYLKVNESFIEISWINVFNILKKNLIKTDPSQFKVIIGNLIDLKSLFYFKKFINLFGLPQIIFENNILVNKINTNNENLSANSFFNTTFSNINQYDLCLLINSNPLKETAILNVFLRNAVFKHNLEIYNIGPKVDLTMPINHLGSSTYSILKKIISGNHNFCQKLSLSKNPLIIYNNKLINVNYFINLLKTCKVINKKTNIYNFNNLNSNSGLLNYNEINFNKHQFINKSTNLLMLYNTDIQINFNELNSNSFIIYQGHHFTDNAQKSDLIIPTLTFLEKIGLFLNITGIIQRTQKVLKLMNKQRSDVLIFKNLYLFLNNLYRKDFRPSKILFFKELPYLKNKQIIHNSINIKNTPIYINFFKKQSNQNINDFYLTNILDKSSKILSNASVFLKKKLTKINL